MLGGEALRIHREVTVQSFDLEGRLAREWDATVELVENGLVRVFVPKGTPCRGPKGGWDSQVDFRAYYWTGRGYNLLELFGESGHLDNIYVHIASEPRFEHGIISYTDYELDIVRRPGDPPRLVDLDEFQDAVERLELPTSFQAKCYRWVADALEVVDSWRSESNGVRCH